MKRLPEKQFSAMYELWNGRNVDNKKVLKKIEKKNPYAFMRIAFKY